MKWSVLDSGALAGPENMAIDRTALEKMNAGEDLTPRLRFFMWAKPTVSYGYLLDDSKVGKWAEGIEIVRRPTGGGAVMHQPTDLSFSLLWPRKKNLLPENPRDCYQEIHERVAEVLEKNGFSKLSLWAPSPRPSPKAGEGASCFVPQKRFSVCFDEPVCNDVMKDGKKIVGGALRLTRNAMLYQGNILGLKPADLEKIKQAIAKQF